MSQEQIGTPQRVAGSGGGHRWAWIAGGIAAVLVIAAVGVALALSGGSAKPVAKPAAVAVAASSAPVSTHLDERAACQLLAPAVQDGMTVMRDFVAKPDGTTVDQTSLASAIKALQQAELNGPPDLQSKVADALSPLADLSAALNGGGNRTLSPLNFQLSGQGILDQCAPYTG
jgi:hypothetical protein